MRIGLLRHGIAQDAAASDFDRALTRAGYAQVHALVEALVAARWAPGSILHSPYVRTTETAEVVHAHYPEVPCLALDALAIGSMDAILQACAAHPDPLLVGHEPTMGLLCGKLMGATAGAVRFERAGFALLEVDRLPTTRPARLLVFVSPGWLPGA